MSPLRSATGPALPVQVAWAILAAVWNFAGVALIAQGQRALGPTASIGGAEFATRCARARVAAADMSEYQMDELVKTINPINANAAKVAISYFQWKASKQHPSRYGDKITFDIGIRPLQQITADMDVDQAAELYQAALQRRIDEVGG